MKTNECYGNLETLKNDIETLKDIIRRQGNALLLKIICEYVTECADKFKFSDDEKNKVMESLVDEFRKRVYRGSYED